MQPSTLEVVPVWGPSWYFIPPPPIFQIGAGHPSKLTSRNHTQRKFYFLFPLPAPPSGGSRADTGLAPPFPVWIVPLILLDGHSRGTFCWNIINSWVPLLSWFTQPSKLSSWLIRVLVMLKHSNSLVTCVIIRNSNFSMCPNIPRSSLGNVWDSLQSRWSPGGMSLGGCNGPVFSPNLLEKSFLKSFLLSPGTVLQG